MTRVTVSVERQFAYLNSVELDDHDADNQEDVVDFEAVNEAVDQDLALDGKY